MVEKIMAARTYPEQGYRSCLGIMRLGQHYEPERVEAAAQRALNRNKLLKINRRLALKYERKPLPAEFDNNL